MISSYFVRLMPIKKTIYAYLYIPQVHQIASYRATSNYKVHIVCISNGGCNALKVIYLCLQLFMFLFTRFLYFFTWCVSVSILRGLLVFFYLLLCNEFLKCLFAFDFMEVFAKKKIFLDWCICLLR